MAKTTGTQSKGGTITMIMSVYVKSGTGGYFNCDGCARATGAKGVSIIS